MSKKIAGIDEAGRGALAGPVVAGTVIFHEDSEDLQNLIKELKDSKQLSSQRRSILYAEIIRICDVGVGIISAQRIDEIGIRKANQEAMQQAIDQLRNTPTEILVDGRDGYFFTDKKTKNKQIPSTDIIKGDQKISEISAASILAKVTRDEIMDHYDQQYTVFEFRNNKGYGSALHLKLIENQQYTPIHRKSYDPLKTLLTQMSLF